jgi:3D (Asp-Asp-Asp) domain-containing protein
MQIVERHVDNKVVQVDEWGMIKHPLLIQFEKDKELKDKIKQRIEKEKLEEQKENQPEWQEFIVSFYTGLDEENSVYGAVNCKNLPLEKGMIANNILPYGAKIYLDNNFGTRVVADTGSKIFNDSNRIDLYVERHECETKEQWRKRAESYGIRHILGYIIK